MAFETIKITSGFFTLTCDDGCYNIRAAITTPVEMEYAIERLKEIHKTMLEKTVTSIKQED